MPYSLTEEQKMLRETARTFAREEVEPLANKIDHDEATPSQLVRRCAELGFFGLYIPTKYGGLGASLTTTCLVLEEIAKASPAFAGLLNVQMVLCPGSVNLLGTEEQKQRLLPASARGERLLAWSQTEPSGAANVAFHLTKLTADGKGYRLNGSKLFCTQGEAKTYLVMAKTYKDGQEGYGCAIVDQESPGFHVGPYEEKLGWRGTNTGTVSFTDVAVPAANILGPLLTGNADIALVNQASFAGHAVTSLGCAQGMFDKTLEYVKGRNLYGEPMHKLSPVSYRMAEVYNKIEACRCMLYCSTRQFDAGMYERPLGSMCKAHVGDTAFECTNTLLQMWGGSGMMNSTGVNRYMRDARIKMVAEGASEMHTAIVSQAVLGLV